MPKLPALLLALSFAALTACESDSGERDTWGWVPSFNLALGDNVTDDPDFQVGYAPGEIYQTQQDLVMVKPDGWNGPIYLVGYATRPGEPTAAEMYAGNPELFENFRGILEEGTRLEIEKLVRYAGETEEIDNDDDELEGEEETEVDVIVTRRAFVRVFAEIVDGPFRGKTVILDNASREDDFPADATGYLPDREVMLRVE